MIISMIVLLACTVCGAAPESGTNALEITAIFKESLGDQPARSQFVGAAIKGRLQKTESGWTAGSNITVNVELEAGQPWRPVLDTTEVDVQGRVTQLVFSRRVVTIQLKESDVAYRKVK